MRKQEARKKVLPYPTFFGIKDKTKLENGESFSFFST